MKQDFVENEFWAKVKTNPEFERSKYALWLK